MYSGYLAGGIYLDNVLIGGRTETKHAAILEPGLVRLTQAGFRLQRKKCLLMTRSVEYLGNRLDAAGLHPTDKKVKVIRAAPRSTTVTELKGYWAFSPIMVGL